MLDAKEIIISKFNKHIQLPIVLYFTFTIGNYSFFRYSLSGEQSAPFIFQVISQIRTLLPFWIIIFALNFDFFTTRRIIRQHWDIIVLGLSWWLSSLVNQRPLSYLFYGPWTMASVIAVLIFICYAAYIKENLAGFLRAMVSALWWGNFIIFILLLLSLFLIKPGQGPYLLLFTSNTFWAYPALILGVSSLLKARYMSPNHLRRFLLYLVYVICVIGIYMSARRSPLFLILISSVILLAPLKLPHLIITFLMIWGSFSAWETVSVRTVTSHLPQSYMKYRLERMFGFIKGRKETSYHDREKIWSLYMNSFYRTPLLGGGLASNQENDMKVPKKLEGYSAHNTFVGMLSETGVLGTLIFVIVIARSLLMLGRGRSVLFLKIYFTLLVPTFLINWVEYNLIPGQIFFLYSMIVWLLPRGLSFLRGAQPL